MYIPNSAAYSHQRPDVFATDIISQGGAASGNWSSLVGIVTAICGNVLISFALNTQRYAHLRLIRGEEQEKDKQAARQKGVGGQKSYGTQQAEIAEHRAQENARSRPHGETIEEEVEEEEEAEGERSETDPLIPSIRIRKSSSSTVSTYRPSEEKERAPSKPKSYLRSPIWWLGISLMVTGEAGNFLAYGFAPASIVSPLGVVALISNCLIAPLLLHEQFRWRDGLGVIIAVAGCVTVVLSASDSNPKLDPDDIWDLVSRWEFETYLGITIFLIIALAVLSDKFGDRTVLIDVGLVGLFGGYTALSTKGVASLLSNTIWRVVTFPITYVLVAVLVFTAIMQIKYINRALQHFSSTIVIPVQFVLFTISVIVGSAILYRDFERQTTEDAIKFLGGCALTFLGVWCITSGRGDENEDEESAGEEDTEPVHLIDHEGVQPEIRERVDTRERRKSSIMDATSKSPALRRLHTTEELPQPSIVPSTPPQKPSINPPASFQLDNQPWPVAAGPANRAAVHAASTSQLPIDPHKRQQPPPMHATTSAPTVPTIDSSPYSISRPQTPLTRQRTGPATPQSPRTPPSRQISLDGQVNPGPGSHKLLNRHSMIGLLPGPLTSPLSSSLSAIVADSLRRGVESPYPAVRRKSMRSRQPTTPGGTTPHQTQAQGARRNSYFSAGAKGDFDPITTPFEEPSGSSSRLPEPHPRTGSSPKGGRARSLSATLEEFFQPSQKRQRIQNEREEEEEEEDSREAR